MNSKPHLILRYILLAVMLSFAGLSLYFSKQPQSSYEAEVTSETEEEYDYTEVQEMVSLPSTPPIVNHLDSETPIFEEQSIPVYDTEELLQINSEFKGWLWIPDTEISYPVVQTADNDTYLSTSFQGTYSSYGCLFLDKDCTAQSRSRVIHGHNMGNNRTEMFSSLLNYQDTEWAGERPYAYFIEPSECEAFKYQLFAVLNFSVFNLDEFNYFQTEFASDQEFHTFVSYLVENSLFTPTFDPEGDILILSTCNSYYGKDNRLLVCYARIHSDADKK